MQGINFLADYKRVSDYGLRLYPNSSLPSHDSIYPKRFLLKYKKPYIFLNNKMVLDLWSFLTHPEFLKKLLDKDINILIC